MFLSFSRAYGKMIGYKVDITPSHPIVFQTFGHPSFWAKKDQATESAGGHWDKFIDGTIRMLVEVSPYSSFPEDLRPTITDKYLLWMKANHVLHSLFLFHFLVVKFMDHRLTAHVTPV